MTEQQTDTATPEAPQAPEAAETTDAQAAPEAPEAAEALVAARVPEAAAAAEAPGAVEVPEAAEAPAAAEVPEAAAATETAAVPDAPQPTDLPTAPLTDLPTAPPTPPRRTLRAVLRWTAAVVVFAGLGTGTALGITAMERTDVPGLATENDGRWAYPKLSPPALPAGAPRPFTEGNDGEVHHADLRKLLLPAPAGAKQDPKLNGGWAETEQYLAMYPKESATKLRQAIAESALRHVASRGWTAPDGTVARIHLLRFNSVAFAEEYKDDALQVGSPEEILPVGVEEGHKADADTGEISVPFLSVYAYDETEPFGAEQTRWAYVQAGDTLGVITLSRKGGVPVVPFQQTVALQTQLLG
ncbi:hypothetical protein [Streptomyces tritici]|uniref:hypothetical protein n=1 Tax=Streptomyces tritici TaxID=2054410 RepID=UPI003AF062C2